MSAPRLPTRKIGGVDVTAIGYGAMNLAGAYTASDVHSDKERVKLLDTLYESGCTNWDTADGFADSLSEDPLGVWFKRAGKRNDIFLATKFGGVQIDRMVNGDPAYVHEACKKSLKPIQVEYSPFTLDIEDDKIALLKTARELAVAVVIRASPHFPDWRRGVPKYQPENFLNILRLSDGLAEKYNATAGQIALVWLLADIIPIPGTMKLANIRENLAATDIKLSLEDAEEVRRIAQVADAGKGDRYPPGLMHLLFADTPALQE
ncbi:hypothetical protein V8D89_004463 [Ganoderma adspersum]